jgi:hypothetical protein
MTYAAKDLALSGFLNKFIQFGRLFGRWNDHCMFCTHSQQEHSVYFHTSMPQMRFNLKISVAENWPICLDTKTGYFYRV